MKNKPAVPILVADDDLEDCKILEEAMKQSKLMNSIHFVHNGEELLSYLRREGPFSDDNQFPMPGLILLDWNMPKKSGREALAEIKKDEKLKHIPVVLLTTSAAEENIMRAYDLGVNSYVQKPVGFDSFVTMMRELGHYWFQIVSLPESGQHG